ncbi:MAG: hypothetical protein NC489_23325 [Ruminococcus flavefaciens]|nr:hypothetical protein [Ruminococcus flavefaciens]
MGAAKKRNIKELETFKTDIANLAEKYYNEGYDDGFEDAKNEDKPAISDGLRNGSSECGKALRKYRKS